MKNRILNTIKKNPSITTRGLLRRYVSLSAPKLQGALFGLLEENLIESNYNNHYEGNAWKAKK